MGMGWRAMPSPILSALCDAEERRGSPDSINVVMYGCEEHPDVQVAFAHCECGRRTCALCGQYRRGRRGRIRRELLGRLQAAGGPQWLVTLNSAPVRPTASSVRTRARALLAATRELIHSPFGQARIRGARAEVDFSDGGRGIHLHVHALVVGDLDPTRYLRDLRVAWTDVLERIAGRGAVSRGASPVDITFLPTARDAERAHNYGVKGLLFDPEGSSNRPFGTLGTDVELVTSTDVYFPGHPGNRILPGRGAAQWNAVEAGIKNLRLTRTFGVLRAATEDVETCAADDYESEPDFADSSPSCDAEAVLVVEAEHDEDDQVLPFVMHLAAEAAPIQRAVSLRDCPRCWGRLTWHGQTSGRDFLGRADAADYRVECVPPWVAINITAANSPRVASMAARVPPVAAP
jgi:hypothetical protein